MHLPLIVMSAAIGWRSPGHEIQGTHERFLKELKLIQHHYFIRGIGLGLVRRFLERGNLVLATTRQPQEAAKLIELQRGLPSQLKIFELDTSNPSSIEGLGKSLKSSIDHIDVSM